VNRLGTAWKKWLSFTRMLGDRIGRVVMTVFYYTLVLPFGLGVRFFSDPLKLKPEPPHWQTDESREQTLESAHRQY
jgi:hypothetical protein